MDPPILRPTAFLNYEHPAVADFARRETAGASGEVDRAKRLFLAVRDGIRYDPYQPDLSRAGLTASATLERGSAFCVPKAILLAAGLRAVRIPARLGFADVTNHLASPRLIEILRTHVFAFHGYVEVYLAGRAVKATPAFNASLCERFGVPPLEFDGVHDAMLQPFDGQGRAFLEYVRDRGMHDDLPYDEMMRVWRETYPHLYAP